MLVVVSWTAAARVQGGFVLRAQVCADQITTSTIDRWLHSGRLERTSTKGVYRVAGAPHTSSSAAWFAALATRSVVTYLTAAQWWDMPAESDGWVHITRLERRRLDWPPGVRIHRVALDRGEVVLHRGLWVTSRRETVLDCLGWMPRGRALSFADRAVQRNWLSIGDIDRRLEQAPGRWGNRQLRGLRTGLEVGIDAESERRLHRLLRAAGLGGWFAQHPVRTPNGRFLVDVAFVRLKLAIEVDGYAYHSHDGRFQGDRSRQNALIASGWRVLRFTWADIVDRPTHVIAQITQLLAA